MYLVVQDFMGSLKGQFLFKLGKPQQWLGHLKATKIRVDEVLLQEFYNFEKGLVVGKTLECKILTHM